MVTEPVLTDPAVVPVKANQTRTCCSGFEGLGRVLGGIRRVEKGADGGVLTTSVAFELHVWMSNTAARICVSPSGTCSKVIVGVSPGLVTGCAIGSTKTRVGLVS